jgi:hypothetical protein
MSSSTELPLGTVLDGQYYLVRHLQTAGPKTHFVAEDILNRKEVELVLINGADGPRRYDVRARDDQPSGSCGGPRTPNRRALERFTDRIVLTGVAMRDGEKLVFSAWDRRRNRAVRVVVEDDESEVTSSAA